jgi:hypothetical protein
MATPIANGAAIWVSVMRLTALDVNGYPAAGANSFVSAVPLKATLTPVMETGDDIAVKNAAGDLVAWGKHGDMVKYGTVALELALPDPQLEQLLCGGTVYNATGTALGAPTGLTLTTGTTGGTLAAGPYAYRVTQYNSYGETTPGTEVSATTTGSTGIVTLSGVTMAAGALGVRIYGRLQGTEQLLGYYVNIGSQAPSAASGTGSVTSLSVTALTSPIPAGYTFQIAGDTNSPKVTFTTSQAVGVGATTLPVNAVTVGTTIAAGVINPVFVDTGAVTPSGAVPTVDLSAGPGNAVGYQAPALGNVADPNGISLEMWQKRMINGQQATDYPWYRIVLPKCINFHIQPRDFTNANQQTVMEGQAWHNPNWGTGPFGDYPLDSTKWYQRKVDGSQVLPVASVTPVAALY